MCNLDQLDSPVSSEADHTRNPNQYMEIKNKIENIGINWIIAETDVDLEPCRNAVIAFAQSK